MRGCTSRGGTTSRGCTSQGYTTRWCTPRRTISRGCTSRRSSSTNSKSYSTGRPSPIEEDLLSRPATVDEVPRNQTRGSRYYDPPDDVPVRRYEKICARTYYLARASSAAAVGSTVGAAAFVVVVSVITGRAIGDVIVLIDSTAIDSVGAAAVVVGEKNCLLL